MNENIIQQKTDAKMLLSQIDQAMSNDSSDKLAIIAKKATEYMYYYADTINDPSMRISFYDISEYADFLRLHLTEIKEHPDSLTKKFLWLKAYRESIELDLSDEV